MATETTPLIPTGKSLPRCVFWFCGRLLLLFGLGVHFMVTAATVLSLCPWIACEDGTSWTWTGPTDASLEFKRYVNRLIFMVPIILVVLCILLLCACFAWRRRMVNAMAIWVFGCVAFQLSMAAAHNYYFLGERSDGTACTFTWGYDLWVYSSLDVLIILSFMLAIDSCIPNGIEFQPRLKLPEYHPVHE